MSELSVLDVQKFLRQHAEQGHDVLTDPRTAHIGEPTDPSEPLRPFGMSAVHRLHVHPDKSSSGLDSFLMHGEQSSGTKLDSYVHHHILPSLRLRFADKIHPTHEDPNYRYEHYFSSVTAPAKGTPDIQEQDVDYDQLKNNYSYFVEESPTHSSIHDALQAQARTPALFNHQDKDVATHHNASGWDINKALSVVSHPLEPFSGLIHVVHKDKEYVYSPKTEEFNRLD